MEVIREWLEHCDYEEGVRLYMRYGKDPVLLQLFEEAYTPFKQKRLEKALTDLLESATKPATVKEAIVSHIQQPVFREHKGWPGVKDHVVQALHDEWYPLFVKLKHLEHSIYEVAKRDEAEAGRMAHEILDLDEQCDALYGKRDHYISTGTLPSSEKKEVVVDAIKWPLMLANAERMVRLYKNKIKKKPGVLKYLEFLKKWEGEVALFRKLLKMDE